ncbi:MAG TPA: cadmium resistance transporter [Rhizomicrobium sp.]|nr:cadmium resistance transporter [Rhizomicrobium sp.]
MIETAIIAFVAFAATNVDVAFVLLAYFANPKLSHRNIVVGTYLGMAVLVIAALLLSAVSVALIPNNLGVLGVLPVLIGLRQLWNAWREGDEDFHVISPDAGSLEVVELVAIRTVANGADNVAVYMPLFAGQSHAAQALTCVAFAVLVGVWCLAARTTAEDSAIVAPIRRWGRWITPVVLIVLGVYIFISNGAFAR